MEAPKVIAIEEDNFIEQLNSNTRP